MNPNILGDKYESFFAVIKKILSVVDENKTEILHISAIQTKITQLKKLILSAFSIYISQVEAKRTEQVLHLHFQNVHFLN